MGEVEMIECPNHGGAFDCTPFCSLCEGNQEIEKKKDWFSLIEQPPKNLDAIARLWDYSSNCQHPTPAFVFLCLTRNEVTEGTEMTIDKLTWQLGEIELGLIGEALDQFSDRPTSAREYVADLLEAEAEL